LDDPADTDPLSVPVPEEPEPDEEYDYLVEQRDGGDPQAELDFAPTAPGDDWDPAPVDDAPRDDRFDAFNASTWNFKPAPTPWFQTTPAVLGIVAVSIALVALVVSVVLLAFQPAEYVPAHGTSTAPSSAPSSAPTTATATPTATSSALPPPPPPAPPPPPPPPPPPQESAPAYQPPYQAPRPTKKPEINVTRAPMSVAPQTRGTR
jgi:hypothetical protein